MLPPVILQRIAIGSAFFAQQCGAVQCLWPVHWVHSHRHARQAAAHYSATKLRSSQNAAAGLFTNDAHAYIYIYIHTYTHIHTHTH